jgi:hypothetical protein
MVVVPVQVRSRNFSHADERRVLIPEYEVRNDGRIVASAQVLMVYDGCT